jgi:hypothetical protein
MRTRALLRGLRFNTDSRPPSISCLLTRNHKSVCLRSRRDLRVTPPVGAICTFGLPFPISSSTEGQPPRNARSSSSVHEPHRKFFSNFKEAGEVLDDSVRHFLLDVMATLDGLVRDDVRGIASPYVQELLGARGAGSSRCSSLSPEYPILTWHSIMRGSIVIARTATPARSTGWRVSGNTELANKPAAFSRCNLAPTVAQGPRV